MFATWLRASRFAKTATFTGVVVMVVSRISAVAGAGEVFVSGGVKQLLVGKQYDFEDQGEHSLRGFDKPFRIWQLKS